MQLVAETTIIHRALLKTRIVPRLIPVFSILTALFMLITYAEYSTTRANETACEIIRRRVCNSDQCAFRLAPRSSSPVRHSTRDPASYSTFFLLLSGNLNFIHSFSLADIFIVLSTDLRLQKQHDADSCTDYIDFHHHSCYRRDSRLANQYGFA